MTTDPTARDKVWAARPIHRRATRANPNPIESKPLPKNLEDARQTKPANAPSSRLHQPWPKRKVNAQQIGGKKNNMRHACLKRLQKLIDVQKVDNGRLIDQQEKQEHNARSKRKEKQCKQQEEQHLTSNGREQSTTKNSTRNWRVAAASTAKVTRAIAGAPAGSATSNRLAAMAATNTCRRTTPSHFTI